MKKSSSSSPKARPWIRVSAMKETRAADWSRGVGIVDALAVLVSLGILLKLDPAARWMGKDSLADLLHPWWLVLYGLGFWIYLQKAGLGRWPYGRSLRLKMGSLAFAYGWSAGLFFLLASRELGGSGSGWICVWLVFGVLLLGGLEGGRRLAVTLGTFLGGDRILEKVAFVGRTRRMEVLLRQSSLTMGPLQRVCGYLQVGQTPCGCSGYANLGPLNRLEEILEKERITLLLVAENAVSSEELGRIAKTCLLLGRRLKVIPEGFHFWLDGRPPVLISGLPVVGMINLRFHRTGYRFAKRAMDILGASLALLFLSPLFLLVAAAIRGDSPGPIFIRQRRVGLRGKEFWILKFRSMRAGAETEAQRWAEDEDPRCTPLGLWLRKMNLDELPQLWNVWKGEMSLVGPRPEMADLVRTFSTSVHSYALRLRMKPGMTGWAAVHGFRGNTSLQERIDHDLYYIQNWSLGLDFRILFMTLLTRAKCFG